MPVSLTKRLQEQLGTTQIARSLFQAPEKEKNSYMLHHRADSPNAIHQADLLYLPHEGTAKYALVCIDVYSGLTDAEPMADRMAKDAVVAIKAIYARKVIQVPTYQLQTDAGTEFQGAFHNYIVEDLDAKLTIE
jgi:hypothetical protein